MNRNMTIRLAACAAIVIGAALALSAAELSHRWSFNDDFADSVGGVDAVKCGTYVSLYGGRVHMGYGACSHGTGDVTFTVTPMNCFGARAGRDEARRDRNPRLVARLHGERQISRRAGRVRGVDRAGFRFRADVDVLVLGRLVHREMQRREGLHVRIER